jgi:hypothetical protein
MVKRRGPDAPVEPAEKKGIKSGKEIEEEEEKADLEGL